MRSLATVVLTLVFLSNPALANDGVLEISQTCAVHTGCFGDDTAGFPVTIKSPGSYRLTGTLDVGKVGTNAIEITAPAVSLDLGGFDVDCVTGSGTHCNLAGQTGTGIRAVAAKGVSISNGSVRHFADDGLQVVASNGFQLIGLRLIENRGDGLKVNTSFGGQVRDTVAVDNSVYGFEFPTAVTGSIVLLSVSTWNNTSGGISAPVSVRPEIWVDSSVFADGATGTIGALTCYVVSSGIRICPP